MVSLLNVQLHPQGGPVKSHSRQAYYTTHLYLVNGEADYRVATLGLNLCGNGWEPSSHTYVGVGTPFPYFLLTCCGNAVLCSVPGS